MARPNKKTETKKTKKLTPFKSENVTIDIRPYEKDNLLGFATVTLYDDIKIYDCKVMMGKNGVFLSYPSRKGNDNKYYSYCYVDKDSDVGKEIDELISSYDPDIEWE